MIGIGNKKAKLKQQAQDGDKPKKPSKPVDDDVYDSGDMAAPERDRDDEQRDL